MTASVPRFGAVLICMRYLLSEAFLFIYLLSLLGQILYNYVKGRLNAWKRHYELRCVINSCHSV